MKELELKIDSKSELSTQVEGIFNLAVYFKYFNSRNFFFFFPCFCRTEKKSTIQIKLVLYDHLIIFYFKR